MDGVEVGRLDPEEWLGRRVSVIVDRPLGSTHPAGGFAYEVNYGYLAGVIAPDGEELDAYVLGPAVPLAAADGVVIAVVLRADDIEDKLVVATDPDGWTASAIERAIAFQERFFTSRVVVADRA
jgi:inorganic pyrophosphatase